MGEVVDGVRYYPNRAEFMRKFALWDALGEAEKDDTEAKTGEDADADAPDALDAPDAPEAPVILAAASSGGSPPPPLPPSDVGEEDVVLAFAVGVVIGVVIGTVAGL